MTIKLFLTSTEILPDQHRYLEKFAGKPLTELTCGLIENAADSYDDRYEEDSFVNVSHHALNATGMNISTIDLRTYEGDLSEYEVLWISGGNTFYLRWLIEEKDFKDKIVSFVESGKVYVWSNAGAIITGPSIQDADTIDDPNYAPVRIDEGLKITKYVVLPHVNNPDCKNEIAESAKRILAKNLDLFEIELNCT